MFKQGENGYMIQKAPLHIIQIVGYKNSGKTTLCAKLISELTSLGYKVGTIKHHGHGGEPDQVRNTDSYIHKESGAIISAAQGENDWLISLTAQNDFNIEDMIRFYKQFGMDIILIEGFKYLDYPKIVLLKDEADYSILDKLSNIRAIGGYVKPNMETNHFIFSIESFHSNKQEIIKLLLSGE